ncbi:hypothetical protein [uncultured Cardiobacterium sp.]|uniref:hypothetical protein n=1 Tax=uncultured Cardiobacterium sp. TaxID=417619 RepID=UPI0026053C7F|nr:hypothetical protein [uncultured Cardiobacterium sp.]
MPFHQATLSDSDRTALQHVIDSGTLPFPPPAIPNSWWVDADHDAALWAAPAADTAPLDFLWHYYLRLHGEYYRFLLEPEPLTSARITLYKLKETLPANCYGKAHEHIIATLKQALIAKTASGEHEAFFNF